MSTNLAQDFSLLLDEGPAPLRRKETPRSNFVTVLGWVLLVVAGKPCLESLPMVFLFALEPPFSSPPPGAPPLFEHLSLLVLGFWCATLLAALVGAGLVRRWRWARPAAVLLFVLMAGLSAAPWLVLLGIDPSSVAMLGFATRSLTVVELSRIYALALSFVEMSLLLFVAARLASPGVGREFGLSLSKRLAEVDAG